MMGVFCIIQTAAQTFEKERKKNLNSVLAIRKKTSY
jgi:hypothetical protein